MSPVNCRPFWSSNHAIIFMTVLFLHSFTVLSTSCSPFDFGHASSRQTFLDIFTLTKTILGSKTSFLNTTPKFPKNYPLWVGFSLVITCLFHLVQGPAKTFTHLGPITTLSHIQNEHAQDDTMQPASLEFSSWPIVLRYSFC